MASGVASAAPKPSRCFKSIGRMRLFMWRLRPDRGFIDGGLALLRHQTDPRLDVLGQILCVPGHAGESARAPCVEPGQSEEVNAGNRRHATHMDGLAASVENRQVDPTVIGAKADAPDDGCDAGRAIAERGTLLRWRPDGTIARL